MAFINSVKLFFSNRDKVLKLFLYCIFALAVCTCLLIPAGMAFGEIFKQEFIDAGVTLQLSALATNAGENIHALIVAILAGCKICITENVALFIFSVIDIFVIFPFLLNAGKYVICEMLYGYMGSKSKVGFFSGLFKGFNKVFSFALLRTLYTFIFVCLLAVVICALGLFTNETFLHYYYVLSIYVVFVLFFTINKVTVTAWAPSVIVFNCSAFNGFGRGIKVVKRHSRKYFFISLLIMIIALGLCALFFPIAILAPVLLALLCMFDMTNFFSSQGMRYYVNADTILTPKRLEEVDSINKAKYIL